MPATTQLIFDLPHTPARGLDEFVETDSNSAALAHVLAWPEWPVKLALITGPEKSGKTHLADIWASRAGAHFAGEVSWESLAKDRRPVLVDGADRRGMDETALFNLLNQAVRGERDVLLTASRPVAEWELATDDVRSRLRLATSFEIAPLDNAALRQMFAKLFADRQVSVEPRVLDYLLLRMTRSPAEVVALVELMDRIGLEKHRPITRAVAAEALALRAARERIARTRETEPSE